MKKVLILALAITMVAGVAMADEISVFSDVSGSACTFNFVGPNLYHAYVVHKTVAGATGSQFKVVNNIAGVAFSAQVMNGYLAIGDAFTDLSLAYGGCLAGPNIACVDLSGAIFSAPAGNCQTLDVVAAPNKVGILTVDCTFAEIPATTGAFVCRACSIIRSLWGQR